MHFNIRNIELKMSKHIRRTYLRSVALKAEDTALIWMLTSAKNKKFLENSKCYRKEIMSSRCLLFICVGLHTDYIFCIHLLIWSQPAFRVSDKS